MTPVFADTFYFLALLNPRDAAHQTVHEFAALVSRIVTTEWVLLELADGLAGSRYRDQWAVTRAQLTADRDVRIIGFDSDIYQAGIDLYVSHRDKEWSLTDCLSFATMDRFGLTDALTGDHHFEQAGFVALLK